jgi:Asp-tRNA(Asn)/Glu-tRNA(Gln) amidotransferase C subunit
MNKVLNISLSELTKIENLSRRSKNVCKHNSLGDISSILNYYWEFEDFLALKNCGLTSNLELTNICDKYEKLISLQEEVITQDSQIYSTTESIHSLIKQRSLLIEILESSINKLSARSLNGLRRCLGSKIDIKGLKLISTLTNCDLRYLRNIGEKSFIEIKKFLKSGKENLQKLSDIEDQIADIKLKYQSNPISIAINSFNTRKEKLINDFIKQKFNCLSIDSSIALKSFLDNDLTIKSFESLIFSNPEFKIELIQVIGDISKNEMQSFLSTIKKQIEFVSDLNDCDIEIELFKEFLNLYFSLENSVITNLFSGYNTADGLPIFRVINILIDHGKIFNEREKIIFHNEFCNFSSEAKTVAVDSFIIGISRERRRQLMIKFLMKLNFKFNFINQPEIKSLINYGFDLTGNYLEITNDLITSINKSEKTNFNRLFITKIIALLYANKFDLIGNVDHKNARKKSNPDNWKGCYIVDKQLIADFDFDKLISDAKNIVTNKIEEDYSLHFRTYLMKFRKTKDAEVSEMIVETAKYILFCEIDSNINTNEDLYSIWNTFKHVYKYSYEALDKLGRPSKVSDIYLKVKELYPDFKKDQNSIRSSMKRASGFVPIGRSSIFGLKKWESTVDNFKGGTIRDIVKEYLQAHAEPKHINEIAKYVSKYRNTNAENIYINLRLDKRKRFIFFRGSFIGISNKEYSAENFVQNKELQKKKPLEIKVLRSVHRIGLGD